MQREKTFLGSKLEEGIDKNFFLLHTDGASHPPEKKNRTTENKSS